MASYKPLAEHVYLDPVLEDAKSLHEVGREVGVSGRVLRSCARRGRSDAQGETHRLEICRLPSGMGTSKEAYLRFLRKINGIPVA